MEFVMVIWWFKVTPWIVQRNWETEDHFNLR
jgi:hypothetical protein